MTMTCNQALLARYADDPGSLGDADQTTLEAHVESCAACRAALDEQRYVSAVLRDRLAAEPQPGLVARVSARIDRDTADGWLGLANWRAWTVGLAPVAAALIVAAFLTGAGGNTTSSPSDAASLEEWTVSATAASTLLEASPADEALLEAVLMGEAPDGR